MFRGRVRHVHFVGIGGIGMSGLAEILRTLEFDVTGSDLKPNENTRRLEGLGVRVFLGHAAENVAGADVVVYSSAIDDRQPGDRPRPRAGDPHHPARRDARRADARRATPSPSPARTARRPPPRSSPRCCAPPGLDPTVVVGGKVNALGHQRAPRRGRSVRRRGRRERRLVPQAHAHHRRRHQHRPRAPRPLRDARGGQGRLRPVREPRARSTGSACSASTTRACRRSCPRIERRHVTYGVSRQADYRAQEPPLRGAGDALRRLPPRRAARDASSVQMPGAHNVLNALAVIAVADELEVPLDVTRDASPASTACSAASPCSGSRRTRKGGKSGDVMIVDDYGHHPAEIEATLDAAQRGFDRRVVVAFQPHRYTRTKLLFERVHARLQQGRRRCSSPTSTRPARSPSRGPPARRWPRPSARTATTP